MYTFGTVGIYMIFTAMELEWERENMIDETEFWRRGDLV